MPHSSEFTPRYISWRFPNTSTTSSWKLLIQITSRYLVASSLRSQSRNQFRGNGLIEEIEYRFHFRLKKIEDERYTTFRVISLTVYRTVHRRNSDRIWGKKLARSPNSIWIYRRCIGEEGRRRTSFAAIISYRA